MSGILLRGGQIVDPSQNIHRVGNLLIREGKIARIEISPHPASPSSGLSLGGDPSQIAVYDVSGSIILPGLIDLHTHLRDPGDPEKETIATGTAAAAAGGYTTILCMANTDPVNDSAKVTRTILDRCNRSAKVKVHPVGAITRGLAGKELADLDGMREGGIVAISDDGETVANADLLYRAMKWAASSHTLVISHCEDPDLSRNRPIHQGESALNLGIDGASPLAESLMVERDILLAEATGAWLHLAHISTAAAVNLIRRAKERGLSISAEATPHHLLLKDEDILTAAKERQGLFRVAPPLRSRFDVAALKKGLREGTIDMIATDHAPHLEQEKNLPFSSAKPGMIGLDIALPLCYQLVDEQKNSNFTFSQLVERMAATPGKRLGPILGQSSLGTLKVGAPADIAVFDPRPEWVIDSNHFFSRSKNTPFVGRKVQGRITMTFVDGKLAYQRMQK
ncbi:MAG: dihydroorotase [Deltaproteobacteria bacterium]|nr:dihydroorotase [Deltaproteobacteria bacterium]